MKVTFKGDYALKALLDLALHYNKDLVTAGDLAQRIDAPIKFLEQVLLDLKKGGFVESRRGNIGGYLLSRAPAQITIGEVIRFIEGPIEPISCLERHYKGCSDVYKCVFRSIWQQVAQATSDIVDKVTFEDLVSRVRSSREALTYQI